MQSQREESSDPTLLFNPSSLSWGLLWHLIGFHGAPFLSVVTQRLIFTMEVKPKKKGELHHYNFKSDWKCVTLAAIVVDWTIEGWDNKHL